MFKTRMNASEAHELFLNSFEPLTGSENLPVEDCDGMVIAEDIIAKIDVPHYRRAAMDGFAVRASDTLGAGSTSPVLLKISDSIDKDTCVRVHTGSSVPDGADAVVMIEDTEIHGDSVEIFAQLHPLKNVGEIGEDIRKDEMVITKGKLLRPCDISVIASMGVRKINVFKKPVVAIIPTGEELVPRGDSVPGAGEVFETNGLMTQLYIKKWGGTPRLLDIVTDNPEMIKSAIKSNLDADLILISGGTSVGKRDFVPGVVASLGELVVHGVGISPGKPTALGIIDGTPVICMPGYPVAGIVALYRFGKKTLHKLGNVPPEFETTIYAVLSEKIASRTGFETFARVKFENGTAIPLATSGAGILSSVSKADGFVVIPENIEGYDKGETVEVELID